MAGESGGQVDLGELRMRRAYSGHGPAITDVAASLQAAMKWIDALIAGPRRMALHGMKRVFVFALMIRGGFLEKEVGAYLQRTL